MTKDQQSQQQQWIVGTTTGGTTIVGGIHNNGSYNDGQTIVEGFDYAGKIVRGDNNGGIIAGRLLDNGLFDDKGPNDNGTDNAKQSLNYGSYHNGLFDNKQPNNDGSYNDN